jgi:hypothetical protein
MRLSNVDQQGGEVKARCVGIIGCGMVSARAASGLAFYEVVLGSKDNL